MLTRSQRQWRKKLTDALRSGAYKQGRRRLRTQDGGFCCQGVACDLVDPTAWGYEGRVWGTKSTHTWPDEVRNLYGFDYMDSDNLVYMNDDGDPFDEIADTIDLLTLAGV